MNRIRYCKNCFMPTSKPGLKIDEKGICQACRHAELKKNIDYKERFKELEKLCDKYRKNDGSYDCIIAVSGGKDSHYQTYIMKEVLKMNPLLVSVSDPFKMTKVGGENFQNISESFSCDCIKVNQSREVLRKMTKIAFEEFGSPTWAIDRGIYVAPIKMAINMGIKLVVYGENVSYEYGGVLEDKEHYSAKEQINNDVAKKIDFDFWFEKGIKKEEINMLVYPTKEEVEKAELEPIYLSYFVKWDGYKNYQIAKKYGFKSLGTEWKREGFIEDYDQIDSYGYLVHPWLKYPKFAFSRPTDVVGYWIRGGKISKREGLELLRKHENQMVDQYALKDFLDFTGYSYKEFWSIVNKFWNRDFFEKIDGIWKRKVKNPWEEEYILESLDEEAITNL